MNILYFLLTEIPEKQNMQQVTFSNIPDFDMTVTISIILAICALFAPSITAIINNRHNYKIRKLELEHDEYLHHSDIQYRNKYEVYKNLIDLAGRYSMFNSHAHDYTQMLSSIHDALLVCDSQTKPLLLEFLECVQMLSSMDQSKYLKLLTSITESFNRELATLSRIQNN